MMITSSALSITNVFGIAVVGIVDVVGQLWSRVSMTMKKRNAAREEGRPPRLEAAPIHRRRRYSR